MKGIYWYVVDYVGMGYFFIYKFERDVGIWNGEEVL